MEASEYKIAGLFRVGLVPFEDERGVFVRTYCKDVYAQKNLCVDVAQCNLSVNHKKHTMRGFHYQLPPHAESKTMVCITGKLHIIVVDLRPHSKTFMQWESIDLSADFKTALQVPAGCANAFLTTEDNTIVHYYMSHSFSPGSYRGFRYDDPQFGFKWPAAPQVISDKDRDLPFFDKNEFVAFVSG